MACTGWSLDEIDRLTLPRWQEMARYWRQHPPLHLLMAAWMGYEAEDCDPAWEEMVASLGDLSQVATGAITWKEVNGA